MLTDTILAKSFPQMPKTRREMILKASAPAIARYNIDTKHKLAAWLGQLHHESAGFTAKIEGLSYSAERLRVIFAKYFPTDALAKAYARKPVAIANRVYAARMGNGDEASGDGWRFRGKSYLQVTGRTNVTAFAKHLGITLEAAEAYLETDEGGFVAAGWFFEVNGLWSLCEGWQITALSARINGKNPANGLEERKALSNQCLKAFG